MSSIDLHIHTIYSDGQHTVSEILRKSEEVGLSTISITDHDTVDAYEELEKTEVRSLFSGKIIPGIEISFNLDGRLFDVLGYDIDITIMKKLLNNRMSRKQQKQMQVELLEEFKNVCKKNEISFNKSLTIKNGTKSEAFNILFTDISNFDKHSTILSYIYGVSINALSNMAVGRLPK